MICKQKLNGSKYCYVSLTIKLNISHVFYTQLSDQTILFYIIQFSIKHLFGHSLNQNSTWPIDRKLPGATTPGQSELNPERWQWKSTLHSPKLQQYCSLNINLFSVIFVGGITPLKRSSRYILQCQTTGLGSISEQISFDITLCNTWLFI